MDVLNIIYYWFAELEPAIWVALFALTLSIVVAFQNWKHNRLSLLPNIDLHHNTTVGKPREITIISSGIGPAIIEEIIIIVEDKHYSMNERKRGQIYFSI